MSYISVHWLILALNTSLQVSLLAAIAMLLLRAFKIHDSNLRHRAWTGVLVGMLALPAFARLVPAVGLPVSIEERLLAAQRWFDEANEPEAVAEVAAPPTIAPEPAPTGDSQSRFADDERLGGGSGERDANGEFANRFGGGGFSSANTGIAEPTTSEPPAVENEIATADEKPVARERAGLLARWPLLIFAAWIAVAGAMLLRLLLAMFAIWRLQWRAVKISLSGQKGGQAPFTHKASQNEPVPDSFDFEKIPVLESALVRAPMTFGFFRPKILLPAEWRAWSSQKLQAVLAHEQMHVRRSDFAVALLAEVNRAIYWFHPLAWWLRRWLAMLAEEACDDAAIDSIGDRAAYARHLLEVAATVSKHRGRIAPAISMARCSHVESRINAILDFTRPLSQRLSWAATLALLVFIIPLIGLTAALRPHGGGTASPVQPVEVAAVESEIAAAPEPDEPIPATPPTETPAAPTASPVDAAEKNKSLRIFGRILDPDGKPLVGAAVQIDKTSRSPDYAVMYPWTTSRLTTLTTKSDGSFEYSIPPTEMPNFRPASGWMLMECVNVIASAKGLGSAIARLDSNSDSKPLELRLIADEPVRGRILNLEGLPMANARIEVTDLQGTDAEKFETWLAAVQKRAKGGQQC